MKVGCAEKRDHTQNDLPRKAQTKCKGGMHDAIFYYNGAFHTDDATFAHKAFRSEATPDCMQQEAPIKERGAVLRDAEYTKR